MTPEPCTCSPHYPITSTNAKLIRRVRKDSLDRAKQLANDPAETLTVRCILWNAHQCLVRLRELQNAA